MKSYNSPPPPTHHELRMPIFYNKRTLFSKKHFQNLLVTRINITTTVHVCQLIQYVFDIPDKSNADLRCIEGEKTVQLVIHERKRKVHYSQVNNRCCFTCYAPNKFKGEICV